MQHENDDEKSLVLKHKNILGVPAIVVAEQIRGRRKARLKLPVLYKTSGIIYPPGVNLEQCSSETAAAFNATVVNGENMADLTGGFGIDSYFFSKHFRNVAHVEPNKELLEITQHNHHQLHVENIQYHNTTTENVLENTNHHFDLLYIDPSRRAESNQKVFKLSDCVPDVTRLLDVVFAKSDALLIKASPLLDLQQGLRELKFVQRIIVLSVENECKEVLFLCKKDFAKEPLVEAVNILSNGTKESFSFLFSEERNTPSIFSGPQAYLYEPNASILKAGAFKSIGSRFKINKLHPSTHVYTAENLIEFPGRIFKIESFVKPDSKTLKAFFPEGKANITTRNYPLSVEELKRKTKLKDGGEEYLIGFSGIDQKFLVVATRLR